MTEGIYGRFRGLADKVPHTAGRLVAWHVDYDTHSRALKSVILGRLFEFTPLGTKLFDVPVLLRSTEDPAFVDDKIVGTDVAPAMPTLLVLEWADEFGFSHYLVDDETADKYKAALS